MTATRRVAAVVVHYGDHRRTVRAVLDHWDLKVFTRIIVVANDLSDRPAELTNDICAWVIPGRNLGFGGGCQLAATTCSADIYAFFNAHVTMDSASVHLCVAAFDIPDVGITAPHVYLPITGNPEIDWKYMRCIGTYSRTVRLPIRAPIPQPAGHSTVTDGAGTDNIQSSGEVIDNEWVIGCAVFCRNEVIRDIGWDGSYFLRCEDLDISMRTRRSGWRVVKVTSALAYHTGEATGSHAASGYHGMRNSIWFSRKYWSRPRQILLTFYLVLLLVRIATADAVRRRRPRHAPPSARGIVAGWALWPSGKDPLPGEPLSFLHQT
jgi:GT2 family glycosyltransferase